MPIAPRTPPKKAAPVLPEAEAPAKAKVPVPGITASADAELYGGNVDTHAIAVAEFRPPAPDVAPKGGPAVAYKPPPPADQLADFSVPPKGSVVAPATPIQIPKGPSSSNYVPPPAKAFQVFSDAQISEEISGPEFEGATVDWLYLFNVGVKKLATLLGEEICYKVVN
jgi:hypothetical protein